MIHGASWSAASVTFCVWGCVCASDVKVSSLRGLKTNILASASYCVASASELWTRLHFGLDLRKPSWSCSIVVNQLSITDNWNNYPTGIRLSDLGNQTNGKSTAYHNFHFWVFTRYLFTLFILPPIYGFGLKPVASASVSALDLWPWHYGLV